MSADSSRIDIDLLLSAYCQGIFPMGDDDGTIRWYSPDPRCIFDFDQFHVSKRLMRTYKQGIYQLAVNRDFRGVMLACADRDSTWINQEILDLYCRLNDLGYAHSVEAYFEGQLAGGLYGVAIGGAFMGESMFFRRTDASKVALIYLVQRMQERGYVLLDTQYNNNHLQQFNPLLLSRDEYLSRLEKALRIDCRFA
ncbi:MAG: leucyl/phenylalanyl-tRNA--protein transferase [Candidatus Obscuribacterales bacterium]|nr:leucyl/phenylalanyl-tRNA--protein transferase [Candidatus Obscuribacterales bacterium]